LGTSVFGGTCLVAPPCLKFCEVAPNQKRKDSGKHVRGGAINRGLKGLSSARPVDFRGDWDRVPGQKANNGKVGYQEGKAISKNHPEKKRTGNSIILKKDNREGGWVREVKKESA